MTTKKQKLGDINFFAEEDGTITWDVCTGEGEGFFCKRQIEAEILSRLVKIMNRLDID